MSKDEKSFQEKTKSMTSEERRNYFEELKQELQSKGIVPEIVDDELPF